MLRSHSTTVSHDTVKAYYALYDIAWTRQEGEHDLAQQHSETVLRAGRHNTIVFSDTVGPCHVLKM